MPTLNKKTLLIAVILLGLVVFPFIPGAVDSYAFSFLFLVFIYALLAQSWNFVAGYAGQVSLGQHAFFGLGAYTTVILWSRNLLWGASYETNPTAYYFDPVTMFLSGLIPALLAVVIGLALLNKLRGDYFALGTLGLGEIVRTLFINGKELTGGAFGVVVPSSVFDTMMPHYWVGLGLVIATTLALHFTIKSRFGLAFIAVRDDEMAASANGVNTLFFKTLAFSAGAFVAGVAGSLYAYSVFFISPNAIFGLDWMLVPLMMVVVGGTGTVTGPVIGAVVMYTIFDVAKIYVPDFHPIISGLTIILVMLFMPKGIINLRLRGIMKS